MGTATACFIAAAAFALVGLGLVAVAFGLSLTPREALVFASVVR